MVDVAESERAKEEILGERMAEDRSYRALNKKINGWERYLLSTYFIPYLVLSFVTIKWARRVWVLLSWIFC